MTHRRWPRRRFDACHSNTEPLSRELPARTFRRQLQRISIARALCIQTQGALLADEPISMLDVSVLWSNVCAGTQPVRSGRTTDRHPLHHADIASARYIADSIIVMYAGKSSSSLGARLSSMNQRTRTPNCSSRRCPIRRHAKEAPPTVSTRRRPSRRRLPFSPRCPHVMDRCRERRAPAFVVARTTPRSVGSTPDTMPQSKWRYDAPEGGGDRDDMNHFELRAGELHLGRFSVDSTAKVQPASRLLSKDPHGSNERARKPAGHNQYKENMFKRALLSSRRCRV